MLLIAVFFFGGEKMPDIAKGLGQGLRECTRAMDQPDEEQEHAGPMRVVSQSNTNGQGPSCMALYGQGMVQRGP